MVGLGPKVCHEYTVGQYLQACSLCWGWVTRVKVRDAFSIYIKSFLIGILMSRLSRPIDTVYLPVLILVVVLHSLFDILRNWSFPLHIVDIMILSG